VHETVATPELVIELAVILVQVKPDGTVSLSVIVPAKLPNAATLIVELLDSPTSALAGEDMETVKSDMD
jgi:hypothetical protein